MVPRSIAAGAEGNRMWRADATDRTFASALRRSLPNDLPQSLPGAHSRLADSQPSPAEFRMRLDELLGILNKGESSGGHALTVTQSSKDGKVLPVPYHRPRCSLRDRPQRGFFVRPFKTCAGYEVRWNTRLNCCGAGISCGSKVRLVYSVISIQPPPCSLDS